MKQKSKILGELDRRNLLRYLGNAALMAPFMRTIFETQVFGAPNAKRAVFFFYPDGIVPNQFHPASTGTAFVLPTSTAPLEKVRSEILLVGKSNYITGGSHEGGSAYCLTAMGNRAPGISIDTYLGEKIKGSTLLPVLRLGVGANFQSGADKAITFGSKQEVLSVEDNPKKAFEKLFGGGSAPASSGNPGQPAPPKSLGAKGQKSVIDFVMEDLKSIQTRLGSIERSKLNFHVESLRELERRTQIAIGGPAAGGGVGGATAACKKTIDYGGLEIPDNDNAYPKVVDDSKNVPKLADIQVELAIQAMACGLTNVVLIQMSHSVSPLTMNFPGGPGISKSHHDISHFGGAPDDHAKSQAYFMGVYANLIEKMKAVKEGDKSLLYNAVTMCVSDLGHSDQHAFDNVGVILAGQAGGLIKTGRAIDVANASHGRTLISILQAMGLPDTKFGEAEGAMPGILS